MQNIGLLKMLRIESFVLLWMICLVGCGSGCGFAEEPLRLASASSQQGGEGIVWGYTVEGMPQGTETITDIEEKAGVESGMIVFFLAWPSPDARQSAAFPVKTCETIREYGAIPVLTWEPFYFSQSDEEQMIDSATVCNGEYDEYLKDFAQRVKKWGHPVLIRFGHEMNIRRYHWGTRDKEAFGPDSPGKYRRMFRHVVRIFREANADNALWVFCPNAESVPNTSFEPTAGWNRISAYYPGDSWVDILGMDGYNWGTTRTLEENGWKSQWASFRSIFTNAYKELRRLAPQKQLFVFETASVQEGGSRAEWLQNALRTAKSWQLNGVCWFQVNKENDWRLSGKKNPEVMRYLEEMTTSKFPLIPSADE